MDIPEYRRLFRALFFIGAMIICFGIGVYMMGAVAGGVILVILGIAVLVISFTMTKFFLLCSLRNPNLVRYKK